MQVIIGSARHDERNKYSGGKAGDQTTTEVSTQAYYKHKKGWGVYRAIDPSERVAVGDAFQRACDNDNVGYAQDTRYQLEKYGTRTTVPCNTDCSELTRVCVKEACGVDLGAGTTTENIGERLLKTGKFQYLGKMDVNLTAAALLKGDILVTLTKGHVVGVTKGNDNGKETYSNAGKAVVPNGKPNLKVGSRGESVKKLQSALNACNNAGLIVDGDFGKATRAAVLTFQKNHGLTPDGIYGPATAKKLKEIMNV